MAEMNEREKAVKRFLNRYTQEQLAGFLYDTEQEFNERVKEIDRLKAENTDLKKDIEMLTHNATLDGKDRKRIAELEAELKKKDAPQEKIGVEDVEAFSDMLDDQRKQKEKPPETRGAYECPICEQPMDSHQINDSRATLFGDLCHNRCWDRLIDIARRKGWIKPKPDKKPTDTEVLAECECGCGARLTHTPKKKEVKK